MQKIQLLLPFLLIVMFSTSVLALPTTQQQHLLNDESSLAFLLNPEYQTIDDILALTPKKYEEMTGKKLNLKERITLKIVQRKLQLIDADSPLNNSDLSTIILLILCLIPPGMRC